LRQGCISLGHIECDNCQQIIPHSKRYLIVDEEDGVEVENGKKSCYCVDCCEQKGYVRYSEEKGEKVLTFFPSEAEVTPTQFTKKPEETEDVKDNE